MRKMIKNSFDEGDARAEELDGGCEGYDWCRKILVVE
jgi:hypothetical protein